MHMRRFLIVMLFGLVPLGVNRAADDGLIAYWKLQGDCQDYSGKQNHGHNHHVDLTASRFNGRDAYIEVSNSKSLQFGDGDFSITAELYTGKRSARRLRHAPQQI